MTNIENKWFGATCSVSNPMFSDSSSLGVDSFWGLFLISGVSSCLALIVFAASFFCRHRHIFITIRGSSVCRKIGFMFRVFDQKDITSHTFRNKNLSRVEPSASPPCSIFQPSPSSLHSNHTDIQDSPFSREPRTIVGQTQTN